MGIPHELVQAIAEGGAVLFIGAGLSQGAGLPGWAGLLAPLAERIGLPADQRGDLLRVAQLCERRLTRRVLLDQLLRETDTTGKGPTANHLRLPRLGLDTWITTNYDDLLEQTLRQAGQTYVKVVQDEDLAFTRPESTTLIKFHGDREQKNTIVLTRRDYETSGRRYRRVREKLSVLLIERTFLFLGYRVNDPDFNQLRSEIAADLQEHDRRAYAVVLEGDAFALARCPATNAMYARFFAAGGYRDGRWWAEAREAGAWLPEGKVKDWLGDARDRPRYWDDERLNGPNQPVIGVTWYEALAYCRWLTATVDDGHVYRLPTEAEWERAARGPLPQPLPRSQGRGDVQRYPWGDEWQPGRANTAELGLGRPTPVGVFPDGASAEGLWMLWQRASTRAVRVSWLELPWRRERRLRVSRRQGFPSIKNPDPCPLISVR